MQPFHALGFTGAEPISLHVRSLESESAIFDMVEISFTWPWRSEVFFFDVVLRHAVGFQGPLMWLFLMHRLTERHVVDR
jgi:hypothetical protein